MKYRLQQPSRRRRSPGLSQPRFRVPVGIAIAAVIVGSVPALAVESIAIADLPKRSGSFKVADIQLQGLQRVSSGTVFNLLPVNVGDTVDTTEIRELTRALFKSGYFDDIEMRRDEQSMGTPDPDAEARATLIVRVVERPAIEEIELDGNKAIKTEDLLKNLGEAGLREGEIFKQATLERIGIELQRSYFAQGRYDATIDASVDKLRRNRVDVKIDIDEGKGSGVRQINFVGAKVFSHAELLAPLELQHPTLLSFLRGKDKYSREKMQGDLETLEAYYQNRGYVEFNARSVQVSITPDKRSVYITVNVHEGDQYTVDEVKLIGELSDVDPALVSGLFVVEQGQTFNRARVTATEERITTAFGNSGYTFASASGVPEVKENGLVDVKFIVDAGKRAYVRRISFEGNSLTQDSVLRREMRQVEGGWASTQQIDRSKTRLDQLGYFKPQAVSVETPQVPGADDQIDVDFTVEELPTGAYTAQLGYSQWGGLMVSLGVQQKNVAGSGNSVGAQISFSNYQKSANFSYHDPYYTIDGISRGFNVFARETNYAAINIARYSTDAYGVWRQLRLPRGRIPTPAVRRDRREHHHQRQSLFGAGNLGLHRPGGGQVLQRQGPGSMDALDAQPRAIPHGGAASNAERHGVVAGQRPAVLSAELQRRPILPAALRAVGSQGICAPA